MAVILVAYLVVGCVVVRLQHVGTLRLKKHVAHDVTGEDDLATLQAFYASTDRAIRYLSAADQKRRFAHWLAEGKMIDRVACCLSCGYPLKGLTADYCPECGWEPPQSFLEALRSGEKRAKCSCQAHADDARCN